MFVRRYYEKIPKKSVLKSRLYVQCSVCYRYLAHLPTLPAGPPSGSMMPSAAFPGANPGGAVTRAPWATNGQVTSAHTPGGAMTSGAFPGGAAGVTRAPWASSPSPAAPQPSAATAATAAAATSAAATPADSQTNSGS